MPKLSLPSASASFRMAMLTVACPWPGANVTLVRLGV